MMGSYVCIYCRVLYRPYLVLNQYVEMLYCPKCGRVKLVIISKGEQNAETSEERQQEQSRYAEVSSD